MAKAIGAWMLIDTKFIVPARRRPLWDMHCSLHCSIIGTCLTIAELRRLARKFKDFSDERLMADYQIHGLFVGKIDQRNPMSVAVQKLLDGKFEGALRKAATLSTEDDMRAYWSRSVDSGLAPAAYWALMSRAHLPTALERHVFGEVHMMSHLCGASHRGEARATAQLVREKADVARCPATSETDPSAT